MASERSSAYRDARGDRRLPAVLSRACALVVVLVGLLVLAGWLLDVEPLRTFWTPRAMKANVAACLVLSGLSLWLLSGGAAPPSIRRWAGGCGVLVTLIGALTLVEHLCGVDLRIDQIIAREAADRSYTSSPGRMPIQAALSLLLGGIGLVSLAAQWRTRAAQVAQLGLVIVSSVSFISTIGYLFGAGELVGLGAYTVIAPHAGVMFLVLSVGILLAVPAGILPALISGQTIGAITARRLFPRVIAAMIVLSYIRLTGQRAGLYDTTLGTSLLLLANVAMVTIVIWSNAHLLDVADDARRHAEHELRQVAADLSFRGMLEAAPDAMIVVNALGEIRFVNDQTGQAFGYSRDELLGKPVEMLVPGRLRQHHAEERAGYFRAPRTRGMNAGLELYAQRKDGSELPVEIALSPLETPNGMLTCAAIRDVSERNRLEEFRTRLAAIVEASDDGIFGKTLDGMVTSWNRGAERIYGYSAEEMVGQSVFRLVPPDAMDELKSVIARITRGEHVSQYETERIRKDGARIIVSLGVSPVPDVRGRIVGISMTTRDISKQRVAAETIRLGEERLRLALDAAQMGVWELDLRTRTTVGDRRYDQIVGYGSLQANWGTDIGLTTVIPEDRESVRRTLDEAQTTGVWSSEFRVIRPDGALRWVAAQGQVLRDEQGKPVRIVGVVLDVTDTKAAARALTAARDAAESAARAKGAFLANMSHEIRTPMNGVLGMTELLLAHPLTSDQRERAVTIEKSAESLLQILDEILDFSKIEAGKLQLNVMDFDLEVVVGEVSELMASAAQRKGIELLTWIDHDVPRGLRGDPVRLRQILLNLLGNAVKFTKRGEILTRVERLDEPDGKVGLRVSVMDTGIGIPEDVQGYIFQPFSQGDDSTTRKHGGTGLGLAISKQLVELMGGKLGVESTPGVGSTFWFTMKLESRQTASAEPEAAHLQGIRVLVHDGNRTARLIVMDWMRSWRVSAEEVAGLRTALERLRAAADAGRPFDVVILSQGDAGMEEAIETAARIRSDPHISSVRVVLVGADAADRDRSWLEHARIRAWLTKPLRQSQVFDCLATVMDEGEPRAPTMSEPAADPAAAEPQRPLEFATRVRILLVDDSPVNVLVALGQLELLGCHADVASSGAEAMAALAQTAYDIVFMDCQMPEMDGYETTAQIRLGEESTGRHAHIIAMTARVMAGDRERCLAAGMDDYVGKPVKFASLREALLRFEFPARPSCAAAGSSSPEAGAAPVVDMEWLQEAAGNDPGRLRKLVDLCLRELRKCLEGLRDGVRTGSVGDMERVAHRGAGASAACGMRAIAERLRALENAARMGTLEDADEQIRGIESEFEHLQCVLRETLGIDGSEQEARP